MQTKRKWGQIVFLILACLLLVATLAACSTKVNFQLSFMVDDAVYTTIDTAGGEVISMPQDPTKEGEEFDGWYWDKGTWQKKRTERANLTSLEIC